MSNINSIIKTLTADLNPRQKDVLAKRFCLDESVKAEFTLAELGDKYGVTRERIRQIEAGALQSVREKIVAGLGKEILASARSKIESDGGVSREDALIQKLQSDVKITLKPLQLRFFLETENAFSFYPEDNDFHNFWYKDQKSLANAKAAVLAAYKYLDSHKGEALCSKNLTALNAFKNFLPISKKFGVSKYGYFGLMEWPEINPRTIRDRAYLVLHDAGEAKHFREIAELIQAKNFDAKHVHASTVHNELIKDGRFVLIGRGVYALSEDGHKPGTTKDVMARILKERGPLQPNALVKLVLAERQFKENTVLLNLQNRKLFRKLEDGRYHVNEA